MKKKKNRLCLAYLKYNSLILYKNGQLPYALVNFIQEINKDTLMVEVHLLTSLCEKYLRVKRYYKKYKNEELMANHDICFAIETIRKGGTTN